MRLTRRVSVAITVGGLCAVSGQIILLRELMVAFGGNELTLAVILAAWLLWGAAGSWLMGGLADRFRNPAFVMALLMTAGAILLPATIMASAAVKLALAESPVEIVSLLTFMPVAFILLAPMCAVLGGLFANGARVLDEAAPARNEVSRAYLLESAGAGLGGAAVSLFVIHYLEPMALGFVFSTVLSISAALLVFDKGKGARSIILSAIPAVLAAVFIFAAVIPGPDNIRRRIQWHGMELVEAGNSLHGSLAAVDIGEQVSLYENGLLVSTVGYRRPAEELVHLGLVHHPNPERVLLIGGGLDGTIGEILKHDTVERCDYVELDPELIEMGRRHLDPSERASLEDEKVSIHNVDGRYFVRNAEMEYDVILLGMTGPRTAQLNRYYSVEFYREAREALREGGIIVFTLEGSETYLTPEQRLLLASVRKTMRETFDSYAILPGDTCVFILSTGPRPLTDASDILSRLDELGVEREYVTWDETPFRVTEFRRSELQNWLDDMQDEARLNLDFRPLGYLYDMAQWSAQFRGPARRWLGALIEIDLRWVYFIPGAFLLFALVFFGAGAVKAVAAIKTGEWRIRDGALAPAVAVTGLSEMIFQITLLVGFQVIYGYLFYRIGILVAMFMVGLGLGSLLLWTRGEMSADRARNWFLAVHAAIPLYPLALPILFHIAMPSWLFMTLPAIAGFLGGLELPLAVRLRQYSGRKIGRAAGSLYAGDSLGACVGAALVSPFLVPILGLAGICFWAAIINFSLLIMLPARGKAGFDVPLPSPADD